MFHWCVSVLHSRSTSVEDASFASLCHNPGHFFHDVILSFSLWVQGPPGAALLSDDEDVGHCSGLPGVQRWMFTMGLMSQPHQSSPRTITIFYGMFFKFPGCTILLYTSYIFICSTNVSVQVIAMNVWTVLCEGKSETWQWRTSAAKISLCSCSALKQVTETSKYGQEAELCHVQSVFRWMKGVSNVYIFLMHWRCRKRLQIFPSCCFLVSVPKCGKGLCRCCKRRSASSKQHW